MQVDFSQVLLDMDGQPIEDGPTNARRQVTLGYICSNALLAPEQSDTVEEKLRSFEVATRVYKGGPQEVSAEDIALTKKKIGAAMTAIIVGQAFRMLEGR